MTTSTTLSKPVRIDYDVGRKCRFLVQKKVLLRWRTGASACPSLDQCLFRDTPCLIVCTVRRVLHPTRALVFIYALCGCSGEAVGHWWSVRAYSNCANAFHNGGAESGGNGYHSRITTTWVGPVA